MKAIVASAPGQVELQEWPMPGPGPGQVRIRTAACGVCQSDIKIVDGKERTRFPSIPGHEWSGRVDAVGAGVATSLVGRPCVGENQVGEGLEIGFELPGGYAQFFLTRADLLHILPENFPLDLATLIEPLAVCLHGLGRLRLDDRGRILIFGDGPTGLLLAMLLEHAGHEDIVLVGGRDSRLALAHDLEGVRTVNYHQIARNLAAGIRERTGNGFKHIVEASGSPIALDAGISLASSGGDILIVGDYGEATAHFPWNAILESELQIVGSSASAGAWPQAVELALANALPLERLITHRFAPRRFHDAIEATRNRAGDCIKAVLAWDKNIR